MHVVIALGYKRIEQGCKNSRLITAEIIGEDQVQCGASLRVIVIVPLRLVRYRG